MRLLIGLGLASLCLTACAGAPVIADPPFTAEQIRDVSKQGRLYRYQVGEGFYVMRFVEVSPDGARVESRAYGADGAPTSPAQTRFSTWEQFVSHASWPADKTTIERATVQTPSGPKPGRLYTVADDDTITRAWFADALPGAPVRHEVKQGDKVVSSMRLIKHSFGAGQ